MRKNALLSIISSLLLFGLFLFTMISHTGCAKVVAPTGGLRDTIPPKIIVEKSTQNLQIRSRPEVITLHFDEWIQLEKPSSEIVVSPPLEQPLDIQLRGKRIVIDLSEETFREDATYVINFGNAVQDFTERNPAKNLRFVFSTGSFIDSLTLKGVVVDIANEKPVADALVMLYDNLSDTVVSTEKPFYFARTNKKGEYLIPYIKSDTFQVLALVDENFNYLYDNAEKIGFSSQHLILKDSSKTVNLEMFQPELPLRRKNNLTKVYGHLRMVYNQEIVDSLRIQATPSYSTDFIQQEKDTLHFWYSDTSSTRHFIITDGKNYTDTFDVKLPKSTDFYKKNTTTSLAVPAPKALKKSIKQNPLQPIELLFRYPINRIDTSKIVVEEDTVKRRIQPLFEPSEENRQQLAIRYKWKEQKEYHITLLPGAVTDFFNLTNDTTVIRYQMDEASNYGNINVIVEGTDADTTYLIELINDKKEVLGSFLSDGKAQTTQSFKTLPTGTYSIRITEDLNGNGRWDTGKYPNRQPEKILLGKSEQLRPNWDLELKYNLREN